MTDYSDGKIYKIVCHETGEEYYGSCVCPLWKRKGVHKDKSNSCMSKQIVERGNWDIVLVEDYPSETKFELRRRERYYIQNNPCVNVYLPAATLEEKKEQARILGAKYRENNKEKIKENKHNYHKANAEIIAQKSKAYRDADPEFTKKRKAEEYLRNKDTIDKRNAEYKDKHREAINKQQNEYYQTVKVERAEKSRAAYAIMPQEEKDERNRKLREKAKAKREAIKKEKEANIVLP